METFGDLVGSTTPRLFTRPLVGGERSGPCGCGCSLDEDSSAGFEFVEFVDSLGLELIPWQRWLAIHALERRDDGRPRFRIVIVLVARQNGKTQFLALLALWWMFRLRVDLVLGTSTKLEYARESWLRAVAVAAERLTSELPPRRHGGDPGVRKANGQQELEAANGARYKIGVATGTGGRSLTVHRLIADELYSHDTWEAWSATFNAMNAVRSAQAWGITNAGDSSSVVLNHFRAQGIAGDNPSLGVFEWSGEDGCELDDEDAWRAANPSLGYLIDADVIRAALVQPPAKFRREVLCQTEEEATDGRALSAGGWSAGRDPSASARPATGVVLGLDVSLDGTWAALVAAWRPNMGSKVRLDVLETYASAVDLASELPAWFKRVKPWRVCWQPGGPAAGLAPAVAALPQSRVLALSGSDVTGACIGFADLVKAGNVLHTGSPQLDAEVASAMPLNQGDAWRWSRRGGGPCSTLYAASFAVHVARRAPAHDGNRFKVRVVA